MHLMDVLPGLVWGLPFIGLARLARRQPSLDAIEPSGGIPVSVIVPARNESANIERVAASVLGSNYHPFELILVDDRSTDDTGARIEAIAATDPRVRVVHGAELPEGWFGKPWACAQGAAIATGGILLFTDADTWHHPELLGRAVAAATRESADLFTLTSQQRCLTFWERVVMPQVIAMLAVRFAPPVVNRATRADQVVANGQFLMFPRASYDALGGHAAVRHQVVEDLALAQLVIRTSRRLRVWYSGELLVTRMYTSLAELVEGWSKNLYVGARASAPDLPMLRTLAPYSMFGVFLFWLLPVTALVAGLATPAALVATLLSVLFWSVVSVGMGIPAWFGVLHPLGAAVTMVIVARSIWRGARRIEWRGRTYTASRA
jgi:chlorobactene glucosyltransferase